jgi:DNA polymerase-3 subunit delta'
MSPADAPAVPSPRLLPWHASVWQQLQAQRRVGRLPHALLLHGPAGLGKRGFAACLAQSLVCESPQDDGRPCSTCRACQLAGVGSHPDIQWVMPEESGKAIKVDAVRETCARSVLTADGLNYRVFLFEPAEQMNAAAANALLKTLEEPVERTVVVLISSAPDRLPATVRSRCQQFLFRAPGQQEALAWLGTDIDPTEFREALALTAGAPLAALDRLQSGLPARMRAMQEDLFTLAEGRRGPAEVAGGWQDLQIGQILELLQFWSSDLIRLKSGANPPICYFEAAKGRLKTLSERIDSRKLFEFLDQVHGAKQVLSNNLNPQMLTERLLIDWCATARSGKN